MAHVGESGEGSGLGISGMDESLLTTVTSFDHLPEPLQQRVYRATGVGCIFALLPRVCRRWRRESNTLLAELVMLDTRDVLTVTAVRPCDVLGTFTRQTMGVSGTPPHHALAAQLAALLNKCSNVEYLTVCCEVTPPYHDGTKVMK